MKKAMAVLLGLSVMLLTGCGTPKEGKLVCTSKQQIDETTTLESTYNVSHKDGYVTQLNTKETITSDKKETLEVYKKNLESVYSAYNGIEHYNNDIKIEGNKLISITKVNYEKLDTKKLIEIDKNNEAAIENGKVKVSVLKNAYEQLNATCKDE